MKLLARFRCCKASIGSLFWYELMANCSVWEVRGLPISQRMTVMSTTGKVKQHFDFDLECPVSRVRFWLIEIRHIRSWFLHGNYCNAYKWKWNHSTILSQNKNNNNKRNILALESCCCLLVCNLETIFLLVIPTVIFSRYSPGLAVVFQARCLCSKQPVFILPFLQFSY